MEIIKVVSFALVALVIILIFKDRKNDLAIQISILAGILIFIFTLSKITAVINLLQTLALKANVDFIYLSTVIKILGIAYIASFCSELCKDAHENNLASQVEFAGKVFILVLAIPILMAVLQSVLKLM